MPKLFDPLDFVRQALDPHHNAQLLMDGWKGEPNSCKRLKIKSFTHRTSRFCIDRLKTSAIPKKPVDEFWTDIVGT